MTQLQNILIKNPLEVMTGLRGERARAGSVDIRVVNGRIAEMAAGLQAQP
ncbi:amidohydrolase, partial [Pseudomonas sp. TH10]|nr:amidohydrolase [Pseudomonas sp. TH10]